MASLYGAKTVTSKGLIQEFCQVFPEFDNLSLIVFDLNVETNFCISVDGSGGVGIESPHGVDKLLEAHHGELVVEVLRSIFVTLLSLEEFQLSHREVLDVVMS